LAEEWQLPTLAAITNEIDLEGIPDAVEKLLAGDMCGRTLVKLI